MTLATNRRGWHMRLRRVSTLMGTVVAFATTMVGVSSAASAHPVCDDYQSYKITGYTLNHLIQLGPTVQLLNKGKTTATLGTSFAVTGSVSMSVSGNITTEESVI